MKENYFEVQNRVERFKGDGLLNCVNKFLPLQVTEFGCWLQVPLSPHWIDEGPLSWYPARAHHKEQFDPYF